MEIRLCDKRDLDALDLFYDNLVKYLCDTVNYPKWTYGVYPCRKTIEEVLQKGWQYACFDGEEIVGAFVFNDDPQGNYEVGKWNRNLLLKEYSVIHTLGVSPKFLKRGIAVKMVNYCIEQSKKAGYLGIRLDAVPTNYPARKLYEKCGFTYIGDYDLGREMRNIPKFSLFELNF